MDAADALRFIERKYTLTLKDKQSEAITSILQRFETFVVLPTGYGKTKIFQYLPELYALTNDDTGTVLVISPLQSLMLDHVAKLSAEGISATCVGEIQKDKSVIDKIEEGAYSVVFSSPEAALTPGYFYACVLFLYL